MARNVFSNFLSALIVWMVIVGGIKGHPPPSRHSEDQRFVEHDGPTPETTLSNRKEPQQLPEPRVRESPSVDYQPRIKLSVMNTRENSGSDGKIVFPSDLPYIGPKNYTPPPAAVCRNTTFCENPPHYPSDFIRNAIKSRDDLKYLATVDTVPEIGQRIDVDDGDTLCQYEDKVIFPKTAEGEDHKWHYIVNEENFPQGVRIEECMTVDTACSIIEGFSDGWKTSCKQKYVYRQLAAVVSNGVIEKKQFRFAASCCCHVKFTGDAASRIGARVASKMNLQSPAVPRTTSSGNGETSKK